MTSSFNAKAITLKQAAALIEAVGTTNTIMLRGQPGVGKSSILKTLSQRMPDYLPCYIDVANLDLGDLGMPVIDRETMVTNYAPNARFGVAKGQTKPVLLMLDELGKASKPVMNMLLPVILEHRLGDVTLPVGSIVFATSNLDTDGVGDNVPAHAMNRMTEVVALNPTADEWLAWAGENDISPEISAFAKDYPQVFTMYADLAKGETNPYIFNPLNGQTRQYVSPRSLEKASNIIKQRDMLGDALLPALAGTVGESAARDIEAMVHMLDRLPRFERIAADPLTAMLPANDTPTGGFLLAFMLAGRCEADSLDAVMTYMNRIGTTNFEAQALFTAQLAGNPRKITWACKNRAFTTSCSKFGKYF